MSAPRPPVWQQCAHTPQDRAHRQRSLPPRALSGCLECEPPQPGHQRLLRAAASGWQAEEGRSLRCGAQPAASCLGCRHQTTRFRPGRRDTGEAPGRGVSPRGGAAERHAPHYVRVGPSGGVRSPLGPLGLALTGVVRRTLPPAPRSTRWRAAWRSHQVLDFQHRILTNPSGP